MSAQEVKLCLVGDSGVGKSSIVQRFVHDLFNSNTESTIGASFMTKTLVVDDITYKFQIWDTAGQERYRALAPMYYRGARAAIIVYDVTQEETFHSVKGWVRELAQHGPRHIVLSVAGNKCDLGEQRVVTRQEAHMYAESINAVFVETSAKTAVNIPLLFRELCKKIHAEQQQPHRSDSAVHLRQITGVDNQPEQTKSSCC